MLREWIRAGRWARQARWSAGRLEDRATRMLVGVARAAARHRLVDALERRDAPGELDLRWVTAFRDTCLVEERPVAPAVPPLPVPWSADGADRDRGWAGRHAYRLRACRVDLATSLTFHRGRVLTASGAGWRSARDGAFLSGAAARAAGARRSWPGPLAPMGTVHNYFHFLIETLPRVLYLRALAPAAPPVFGGPLPAYAVDVLTTLGVPYRVVDDPVPVVADDVWLCEPMPTDWPHPADLDLLRRSAETAVPGSGSDADALYLSRRASSRSIGAEQDLEGFLQTRGFRVLAMQALPFVEQVRAVRGARLVVAPHGAGLANVVFGGPDLQVVELTAGDWWRPSYRNLCAIGGQRFRIVRLPWSPDFPDGRAADAITQLADVGIAGDAPG